MPTEYSQVLGKFEKEVECTEKNPLTLAAKITLYDFYVFIKST